MNTNNRHEYIALCDEFARFYGAMTRACDVAKAAPEINSAIIGMYEAILACCNEVLHTQLLPAYKDALHDLHSNYGPVLSTSVGLQGVEFGQEIVFVTHHKLARGWLKTWISARSLIAEAGVLPPGLGNPAWAQGMRNAIHGPWD